MPWLAVRVPPMTQPHLALLLHSPDGGGAQRRTLDLAGALAGQGFAVTLVLIEPDGPLKRLIPASVKVEVLHSRLARLPWAKASRARQCLAAIPALARWLRQARPDLLMAAANHVHMTALAAHALAGKPCPLVLRASNDMAAGWFKHGSVKLHGRADAVVAVSEEVAEQIHRQCPSAHLAVLPNPVVDGGFPSRMAAPAPHPWLSDGKPVVVGCGRLEPQKDFTTLIRAAARLGLRVIILGEGAQRKRLKSLAEVLKVPLEMPGFVADPLPWMARASAFVLSSAWEGMPGALIEAMACGCPAVSTRVSGAAEALDGLGPLVPVGDDRRLAEALAHVLAHVLAHPPPRSALIRRAQGYSVTAAAMAYGGLFTALLDKRGRHPHV